MYFVDCSFRPTLNLHLVQLENFDITNPSEQTFCLAVEDDTVVDRAC